MQLARIGIAVGLAAALGLTRVMNSLLFGVSTTDADTPAEEPKSHIADITDEFLGKS
jgi:hypothetical protein